MILADIQNEASLIEIYIIAVKSMIEKLLTCTLKSVNQINQNSQNILPSLRADLRVPYFPHKEYTGNFSRVLS